jgi:hypothetical protein
MHRLISSCKNVLCVEGDEAHIFDNVPGDMIRFFMYNKMLPILKRQLRLKQSISWMTPTEIKQ